jgi:hypothetical protein
MFAEELDQRQEFRRDGSIIGYDALGLIPINDCQLVARCVRSGGANRGRWPA